MPGLKAARYLRRAGVLKGFEYAEHFEVSGYILPDCPSHKL